jgi:fatty acid desaturase
MLVSVDNKLLLAVNLRVGFDGVMTLSQAPEATTPAFFPDPIPALPYGAAAAGKSRLDIPTIGVALAVYGGFILSTWFFRSMPVVIAAPLGALLLTWYGSLQHETIHDHPTASRRLNAMLASLPLSLWIPYGIYRATHLQHHRHGGRHLTEVRRDPESFYLRSGVLSRAGIIGRALHLANCTLAGRLILGPAIATCKFWASEARMVRAGDRRRMVMWARHAPAVAMVLLWTVGVCRIPILVYVALVVYPSISLSQLRSFAEHRAHAESPLRTATVEAGAAWALIFLNNNLHIAHHAYPKLPWYELPRVWRQMRAPAIESGLVFQGGYGELFKEYLLRPVITAEHPGSSGTED